MEDKERLRIVLKHLIEHNEGHAEDYKRWVELAGSSGTEEAARLISEAGGPRRESGRGTQEGAGSHQPDTILSG